MNPELQGRFRSTAAAGVVAAVLVCMAASETSQACSLASCEPTLELNHQRYILVGTVAGYVGPLSVPEVAGEFWGTRVIVKHSVYTPKPVASVDVFDFSYSPECARIGDSRSWLEKVQPIGSDVLVFAAEAITVRPWVASTRLEAGGCRGGIVRSPVPAAVAATRVLDSEEAFGLSLEWAAAFGYNDMRIWEFEIQKELVRLESATLSQKVIILRRLSFYPTLRFDRVVRRHLGGSASARLLVQEWTAQRTRPAHRPIREATFVACSPGRALEVPEQFTGQDGTGRPRPMHALPPDLRPLLIPLPELSRGSVDVIIDEAGTVTGARVQSFGGPRVTFKSIRDTACTWRFEPAMLHGRTKSVWDSVSFTVTSH